MAPGLVVSDELTALVAVVERSIVVVGSASVVPLVDPDVVGSAPPEDALVPDEVPLAVAGEALLAVIVASGCEKS